MKNKYYDSGHHVNLFPLFCSYDLSSTYYPQYLPSFRMKSNFHTPVKDQVNSCFNHVRDLKKTLAEF